MKFLLEQTKRTWKCKNENETELKIEKEKNENYYSSTMGQR
jgi:hypothetical protein